MSDDRKLGKTLSDLYDNLNKDQDVRSEIKGEFIPLSDQVKIKPHLIQIALVILIIAFLTFIASNNAKPGDLLYPLGRSVESIQIAYASLCGDKSLGDEYLTIAKKRIDDIGYIVGLNSTSPVSSIITIVFADTTTMDLTDQQKQTINQLSEDYQTAMNKAQASLNNLKESNPEQAEDLANSMLQVSDDLHNTLIVIKGRIANDSDSALDKAITFTTDFNSHTSNVLHNDLAKDQDPSNPASNSEEGKNNTNPQKAEANQKNTVPNNNNGNSNAHSNNNGNGNGSKQNNGHKN